MSKLGGKVFSEDTDRDTAGGQVDSVVAGANVTVDDSDPANPIVASTAAGSPTTTKGDLIKRGASADERLPVGPALEVLRVNAAGDDLEFAAATGGETNTGSNLGAGEGSVFKQKNGVDFEHRTLKAGTNITITEDANEILIVAAGSSPATFEGALVTHSVEQTVNSSASALTFDTETYDVGGWHDNAVNPTRLTVPSGVSRVRLTGGMQDGTSVAGQFQSTLSKNGSVIFVGGCSGETESAGGDNAGWASPVLEVVEGDFFENLGFATNSRTTNADGRTYFSIEKVS